MKVTLNWLKDFVDFDLAPEELADKLTMVGLEVENIIQPKRIFKNVVIGQVVQVTPIPQTAQLKLCQVSLGSETIQTICGAPNVRPQLLVPLALPGAELPNGVIVSQRNFDGYTSLGMICSEAELGLTERGDSIMELANIAQPGMDLLEYVGPGSPVLDIAITPNRPDCLSVIGIAREVAGIVKSKLLKPMPHFPESEAAIEKFIHIEIRDADLCPRYCGRYFSDVAIAPSPWWLAERLHACGIRPINNIVDITNYAMLETGQPLHAFDYNLIADHKIVVKTARRGDNFTTLDGKAHELNETNLMICDGQKPVALAGIMGGLNSEISSDSKNIFLESAYFSPTNIRMSSKRLGIASESSMRFERGADPENATHAINRAAQLIHELTGARIAQGVCDVYPKPIVPVVLELRPKRVNQVLGTAFSTTDMQNTLAAIELKCEVHETIQVTVPTNRPDLTREIDLIEEIARLIGYDQIEPTMHAQVFLQGERNKRDEFQQRLRSICVGMGFSESVTLSMLNSRKAEPFLARDSQLIRLLNPLSEDLAVMRPSLVPSLLEVVAYNRNRQNYDLKLFEIGSIYYLRAGEPSFKPIEMKKIVGVGTGLRLPVSWLSTGRQLDFYDAKGFVEHILHKLSITQYQFKDYSTPIIEPPGAGIQIAGGQLAGFIGFVNKQLLDLFDIKGTQAIVFELDIDALYQAMPTEKRFQSISRYPTIPFDLAVVLDREVPYSQVEQVIRTRGGEFLLSVRLFDTFEGNKIPTGKKSMAFSLIFGSKERTLGIDEVNEQVKVIISELARELGAYLRTD